MTSQLSENDAAARARSSVLANVDPARKRRRERQRALGRGLRRGLLVLAIAGAAAASVLALRPSPVPVEAARVQRGPLVVAIQESGTTRVKDRYLISAPVTGSVSRISLEPGDLVQEGDVLAEIAPATSPLLDARTRAQAEGRLGAALSALDQSRIQVQRAQSQKEHAEQELARAEQLFAAGSLQQQATDDARFRARLSADELASAEFGSKVAAEEARIARVALGADGAGKNRGQHVDVLAPISGRVLKVHQESATVVSAGAGLVEIGDPSALEIVVDLLTTDAVHVEVGTLATVEGWGGSVLSARVRRIEPSAFTRTSALGVDEQRVNVILALSEPRERWAKLGDGYRVEVRLVLWQAGQVTKLPQGAVFRSGTDWAVFRVTDQHALLTPVRVGHRGDAEVELVSGLEPGALVVVHPGERVKSGVRVEIQ